MKYIAVIGIWACVAVVGWQSPATALVMSFCATVASVIITVIETD